MSPIFVNMVPGLGPGLLVTSAAKAANQFCAPTARLKPRPFKAKSKPAAYRITMFSEAAFDSKGWRGVLKNPYMLAAPMETKPSASARQR